MTNKKLGLKKADIVSDYKLVFGSEAGERVLFDLMKVGHFMGPSYQGDVHDCIFAEGERNIVNYILTLLKQDPVKLKKLIDRQEEEELNYV